MRELLRRRLDEVEELHRLKHGHPQAISIFFVNPNGTRVSPTAARGPHDFECWRNEGEGAKEFESRARAECRATVQHPLHILVFHTD
jgi:hypothetical protein